MSRTERTIKHLVHIHPYICIYYTYIAVATLGNECLHNAELRATVNGERVFVRLDCWAAGHVRPLHLHGNNGYVQCTHHERSSVTEPNIFSK